MGDYEVKDSTVPGNGNLKSLLKIALLSDLFKISKNIYWFLQVANSKISFMLKLGNEIFNKLFKTWRVS